MRVNYLIALFLITCLSGCNTEKGVEYITNLKAADYFEKVESICNKDNGDLWGMNLYGPLMLVDVETRRIFANMPDSSGLLKPRDGIYTGIYPGDQVISDGNDLCLYLLDKTFVALVPGSAFGDENCIRLSYATSEDNLKEAMRRIKEALAELK